MTYYPPDDPFYTPCCGVKLCGDIEQGVVCPYCGVMIEKLSEEEAQAAFEAERTQILERLKHEFKHNQFSEE